MEILREWLPPGPEPASHACAASPDAPVVLDFGSAVTRVGVAGAPAPAHAFAARAARFRDRKSGAQRTLAGHDVLLDPTARAAARSPFDGPLLTNWDTAEALLDYAFDLVGYTDAPVAVSEPLLAPLLPHRTMQELLFEGYAAPAVAFGADALGAAHFATQSHNGDALLVFLGNEASVVLPVVQNQPQLAHARRINFGARHAREYMHALLVLKYPTFPAPVTALEVQQIVEKHCFVALDYRQFTREVLDLERLPQFERVLQAPVPETSEDTLKLQEQAQRRRESGKRLQEQAQAARAQRLRQQEEELQRLRNFESRLLHELDTEAEAAAEAREAGFDSLADVHTEIRRLDNSLRRARGEPIDDPMPDTSLLEVDDAELDASQLQLKRRQRLLKASYDARQRAKAAKAAEQSALEQARLEDEQWRERDLRGWADARRVQLREVSDALAARERLRQNPRLRFKQSLSLAVPSKRAAVDEEDLLAEEEEEPRDLDADAARLKGELLEHDPTFTLAEFEPQSDWRQSVVHKFLWGARPYSADDSAQQYQLNVNVERARVVEPLFDPAMVGLDQAGLAEVCTYALKQFPQLARNVVLSGGFAAVEGLAARLQRELVQTLPAGTQVAVSKSDDVGLDAWRGIALWAANNKNAFVSRQEYDEYGADYIKEHPWGNPRY